MKREGGGCCAMGCLTMVISAFVVLALILAATWWAYGKALDTFTSRQPGNVQLEPVSDAQFAEASEKLAQVRNATASQESLTVGFTAAELNALIARHPEFEEWRGKVHVAIADSLVTLDLSVPLDDIPLPRMNRRWFVGNAQFGFVYGSGRFSFNLQSIGANGRNVPDSVFRGIASVFDNSFNEGFDKTQQEDARSKEFWSDVKSIGVVDDKLIVTTKGSEAI